MFPFRDHVSKRDVTTLNFGRPVLEFSVLENGDIMVTLDGEWRAESSDASAHAALVKISSGKVRICQ